MFYLYFYFYLPWLQSVFPPTALRLSEKKRGKNIFNNCSDHESESVLVTNSEGRGFEYHSLPTTDRAFTYAKTICNLRCFL